jgi:hypothetical protein
VFLLPVRVHLCGYLCYCDRFDVSYTNYYYSFSYYLTQKKTLEINPRHPLIKELLKRVQADPEDRISKGMALMMFQTGNWEKRLGIKPKRSGIFKMFLLFL